MRNHLALKIFLFLSLAFIAVGNTHLIKIVRETYTNFTQSKFTRFSSDHRYLFLLAEQLTSSYETPKGDTG